MIISIASGKGGTGKTTVATNLALSLNNGVQFLDCDVEEPNAYIFLKPSIKSVEKTFIPIPKVDEEKCSLCGKCQEVCAYNAIAVMPGFCDKRGSVLVFPQLCHGCGGCSLLCPQKAITETRKEIGVVEIGHSSNLQFIHGRLNIGETMSPPLIRAVKEHINPTRTVIIDAPPGTSCPVIEAVKESDFCILVTEPTPFGLNDLILAVEVLKKMQIPFGVVVNRFNIGDSKVSEYCLNNDIPILMSIPFDIETARAYSKGIPMVEAFPERKVYFQELFERVENEIKTNCSN